jgi:hypothetical protein
MNIVIGVIALIFFTLDVLGAYYLHNIREGLGFCGIEAALFLIAAAVAFHG